MERSICHILHTTNKMIVLIAVIVVPILIKLTFFSPPAQASGAINPLFPPAGQWVPVTMAFKITEASVLGADAAATHCCGQQKEVRRLPL